MGPKKSLAPGVFACEQGAAVNLASVLGVNRGTKVNADRDNSSGQFSHDHSSGYSYPKAAVGDCRLQMRFPAVDI